MKKSNLNAAIGDVDKILEMLERTREQVAQGECSLRARSSFEFISLRH
jgi:hypothetical protein